MNDDHDRAVQLHITHDRGGGSERWLRDFIEADHDRSNLILRSFSHGPATANGLILHRHGHDSSPMSVWTFTQDIDGVALGHSEYRSILESVIREYGVGALLVSSLIGHSLDALATGLPTIVVTHDYFPYCANITPLQGAACQACSGLADIDCRDGDARLDPFPAFTAGDRAQVRDRYVELVTRSNVTIVSPSRSVAETLTAMNAQLASASFETISHGYARSLPRLPEIAADERDRLRVVVLGQLSVAKGARLLSRALPAIARFADVYLVGCRELGEAYRFTDHVHLLSNYEPHELAGHMAAINPHVGVLASIWPETFGYTLSELLMLGVPPVVTRLGAFAERIRDGEDGYLFEPDPRALVEVLRAVNADRTGLARIRRNLRSFEHKTTREMVDDYHRILPIGNGERTPHANLQSPDESSSTMTLASMWKEVQRLHVHLFAVVEARWAEQKRLAALEQTCKELRAQLQLAHEANAERERQIEQLSGLLHSRNLQIDELHASTSWKVSAPVRVLGRFARKLRILARSVAILVQRPSEFPSAALGLMRAWRGEGLHGIKRFLVALQPCESYVRAWADYRRSYRTSVRPALLETLARMAERPLISVIVPTFNTPEKMLCEMIESVLAQVYPVWELCVSDDGSTEPHVKRVLQRYAASDSRIRLHFESRNRGVSHASNRALDMAKGSMIVLLDHDDLLEEQALFRVAQSFVDDEPDMLYSDEALVTPEGEIRQFVYRPAFSPEYLRGHPYIVHLVAFRAELLRDIGGFDESLHISQDYDLILRASCRARRIVHIPEILYLWRTHASSAGHRRMSEVMQVSTAILRKDLERTNASGTVREGPGFNLFDVRYGLRPHSRVAIIIPTRNHGELLRQCIDSIVATVHDVEFDIVVIDHESDEPQTLAYLAEIGGLHEVLRYEGEFNFSDMNNWAVRQLRGDYSHYLLCNNDIQAIEGGWLERMLELCQQPSIGIVGARLLYPDRRTIQHAGVCVGAFRAAEHYGKFVRLPPQGIQPGYQCNLVVNHEVAAVTGACLLIRRDAFESVQGFDPEIRVGFGDVDLCLRVLSKGYRVVYCAYATLVHHESYTRGTAASDAHPEDTARFRNKWSELLKSGDPYYNPGLALNSTMWAVHFPLNCHIHPRRRVVIHDAASDRWIISTSSDAQTRAPSKPFQVDSSIDAP